jgi:hypothetical protein
LTKKVKTLFTFLKLTGSFKWLSLPTGAAKSPVYITDVCNQMLHFKPEDDQSGSLIYEFENVEK